MDTYKIKKANELYSKLQGAIWAREKSEEYGHYEQCETIRKQMGQWYDEIRELELNEQEQTMVGYDNIDYNLANYWEGKLR